MSDDTTKPAGPPRYRRARELAGLSLPQAAKLLGWAQGPLWTFENGVGSPPTEDDQRRMAELYRCSLAWLQGAEPVIPEGTRKMLREADISDHDREVVLEVAGMWSGMSPQPSVQERLAVVAAKHDPPMPPRAAKVRHVRGQGQTREHHCHWPGCDKQVPPAMWGCKAHWFRLPKALRDRVWNAYRPGQEATMTPSAEYLQVADDVQRWIREHGGAK